MSILSQDLASQICNKVQSNARPGYTMFYGDGHLVLLNIFKRQSEIVQLIFQTILVVDSD